MNGPLHTEIRGDPASGRTVVFLPGLGGTTRYWASRIAALEDRYRIVLVDLLGFGDSPRPWTRYSVARHVEARGEALEPYGRVTLVGHSLGALLAIAYAARYPDRVGGLALLGMPCFAGQRDAYAHYRHGPMRAGFLATNVALAAATCILTRRLLGRLLPYLIRHVPREVAEDLAKHNWRSSTSSLWEVVYRYDAVADLEVLPRRIDVLFIHGGRGIRAASNRVRVRLGRGCAIAGVDLHAGYRLYRAAIWHGCADVGGQTMARVIKIRRGLDVPSSGTPRQVIDDGPPVGSVAVLGRDYVGLKPVLRVGEGDRVALGQPLIEDGGNPGMLITSPAGGTVVAIHRGARRRLESLVINVDGDEERSFPSWPRSALEGLDGAVVRRTLVESGLWVALRTRPFGRVPVATDDPPAIFVTVIDTEPLAADPAVIVAESGQAFADGLRVLTRLTSGSVYVCTGAGGLDVDTDTDRVETVAFVGPHPAGLVGTHIHHLHPVRQGGRRVWYLGYQDVIAIGRLFVDGRLDPSRVIALGGPQVREPRLVRSRLGADVHTLVAGGLHEGPSRLVSGSVLSGRRAVDPTAFLGRYHLQVSVLPEESSREFLGWLAPGRGKFSASRMFASSLMRRRHFPLSTSQHGSPRAMVPIGSYERVMPLDVLITPLLKALLVGDTETARLLGCLELEEEDLALCSFVCCSKYEFGPALRDMLASIERTG